MLNKCFHYVLYTASITKALHVSSKKVVCEVYHMSSGLYTLSSVTTNSKSVYDNWLFESNLGIVAVFDSKLKLWFIDITKGRILREWVSFQTKVHNNYEMISV